MVLLPGYRTRGRGESSAWVAERKERDPLTALLLV